MKCSSLSKALHMIAALMAIMVAWRIHAQTDGTDANGVPWKLYPPGWQDAVQAGSENTASPVNAASGVMQASPNGMNGPIQNDNQSQPPTYAVIDLGSLGGASDADGINSAGQVVGWSYTSLYYQYGFLWQNGSMQNLGPLSGVASYAYGINSAGQVVGYVITGGNSFRAFLWQNGSMQDLGSLGGNDSEASGINSAGQVVGYTYTSEGNPQAFLSQNGSMQDLGDLGGGTSYAYGINSAGQVVGWSYTSLYYPHAFLWQNGSMQDLGTLSGKDSYAYGINSAGQIVGFSDPSGGGQNAFLWQNGTMYNLNSLLFNQNSGWVLQLAQAINDSGQIVGSGTNPSGQQHAFLLNPLSNGATTALTNNQTSTPTYGDMPVNDPSDDGLIVVTHGWTSTVLVRDPVAATAWIDTVSNEVVQRLATDEVSDWQVFAYHWAQDSYTTFPDTALGNAKRHGVELGLSIVSQGWTHVHLIAHSAGAALIESCAEVIKSNAPNTVIQCTFLDPYVGTDKNGYTNYGKAATWSDNYFCEDAETGDLTQGSLSNAYNVDVTELDTDDQSKVNYFVPGAGFEPCHKTESVHFWPVMFYTNTIGGTVSSDYQSFGYPLSMEGGLFTDAETTYYEGDNPALVLGNPDPPCSQNGLLFAGPDIKSAVFDLPAAIYESVGGIINSLGNAAYQLFDPPGAPVWLGMVVTPTNAVNAVSFDAEFTSAEGSHGILSVYWDTNMIGLVDEAAVQPGLNHFSMPTPVASAETSHVLGFHLDPFTDAQSSIILTNIALDAIGVTQPPILSVTTNSYNGLLVYQLMGQNDDYVIQANDDLTTTNWVNIAIVANTNGAVQFVDPDSTNYSTRFYRAMSQ